MKAIKFNLSYGNERIKTLAELKENCNVDMLLETLKNGLLVRWLTAQGETAIAEKVSAIDKKDNRSALNALLKILFGTDSSIIEQAAAEIFTYREKEITRLINLKNLADKENGIISQYHKGYDDLIESLKTNKDDYPSLKANMNMLYAQYRQLLLLDKTRFYNTFKDGYPLVLLALMANATLRDFIEYDKADVYKDVIPQLDLDDSLSRIEKKFINGEEPISAVYIENEEQLQKIQEKYKNTRVGIIYKASNGRYYSKFVNADEIHVDMYYVPIEKISVSHIKIFSGKTDQYWKDIEPRGKKFMIISMEEGNKLRNAGVNGEELSADDINKNFIFTNGIDYMSNSDSDRLIYMEV
ncbi:MAG: hypothetical protein J6X78_06395 [Treponema sp.]|nr:hypothetical protein [Treponema sp.]